LATWIFNFPLPPSVNEYLLPVAGKLKYNKFGKPYRQGHLTKSKVFKDYENRCQVWALQNKRSLQPIIDQLHDLKFKSEFIKQPFAIRADVYFAFEHSRLITVNNKVEQLDRDNRLKPLQDMLGKILGIDDKHVFSGICEKVTTTSRDLECAVIRMELMTPRTLDQVRAQMKQESSAAT
jgi:Holliday junction resolvase RusA-like endonuclease